MAPAAVRGLVKMFGLSCQQKATGARRPCRAPAAAPGPAHRGTLRSRAPSCQRPSAPPPAVPSAGMPSPAVHAAQSRPAAAAAAAAGGPAAARRASWRAGGGPPHLAARLPALGRPCKGGILAGASASGAPGERGGEGTSHAPGRGAWAGGQLRRLRRRALRPARGAGQGGHVRAGNRRRRRRARADPAFCALHPTPPSGQEAAACPYRYIPYGNAEPVGMAPGGADPRLPPGGRASRPGQTWIKT